MNNIKIVWMTIALKNHFITTRRTETKNRKNKNKKCPTTNQFIFY